MSNKFLKNKIINTLDISIIIIAVAVLVATAFKINNKQIFMLFDKTKDSVVTVSATTSDFNADDFEEGEKIYFADSKEAIGTIISAKNIKDKKYTAINNTLIYDYTDKDTGVLIEIKAKIKENGAMKYINSSVFTAPGTKYFVYTSKVPAFECVVDDINVK